MCIRDSASTVPTPASAVTSPANEVAHSAVSYTHLDVYKRQRPLLPVVLADKVPAQSSGASKRYPACQSSARNRRMIALAGCVQPTLTPNTNAAAVRILGKLGIELFEAAGAGCCGALRYHWNAHEQALDDMRRVIDAWWPHVEGNQSGNVEAIVMTASGCGAHVREYCLLYTSRCV